MDRVFLQVLNMSITASYVILLVIVVRQFMKKLPKIFSYLLWAVVFFRLVCPFSFDSIYSLLPVNTQTIPPEIIYAEVPQINSGVSAIDQGINNILPAPATGASVNPMQIWLAVGTALWLLGVAALFLYSVITTIKLSRSLKNARHIGGNIYESRKAKTPFILGLFSPKIYLPLKLSEREKEYIIKHEETHIKRYDHLVKVLAFAVLCIHWFNPLVWLAFSLMCKDMELSCDERVVGELGSEIIQDYSTSLLSLSTGRPIMGGSPLAFGENNTKGRILNLLNYQRPALWVVVVAIIVVAAVAIGLMGNPAGGGNEYTVESFANAFIADIIDQYETGAYNFKIVASKITKLAELASFEDILPHKLEIWALEYRLKPEDLSKVMFAGGMNEVDGWLTEDASMGKPLLVFSYEDASPRYLGVIWSGEEDLSTPAGQEMALRKFLEREGLLAPETHSGEHILVGFTPPGGENCQLFLSQPATQGPHGIWCVERWMDGNGNLYYLTPETDLTLRDYYAGIQGEVDQGHQPWLIDPRAVAQSWINNYFGLRLGQEDLKPKYGATFEDFLETPESRYIGHISNFVKDKHSSPSFHLYPVESNYPMFHQVTDTTQYNIVTGPGNGDHRFVTVDEFIKYLEDFAEDTPLFWVVTKDGYVKSITEQDPL